ncbi:winged helix-turn-helix domain-containing protein [Natronospira bacteriovora]|uniref:Winged helix-turn-helix domain-containing protein n=1 Tax=Natronospira bacteriovora TaxID=3069753 RepID=A0ABU0W8L6_9GAMM|nr:winged helix-turn-helix domain-containing protein [Natronospira sp. AB-CW4]MDQ2070341.1 winged helix-turn-helix domain-containing protein [Natronospira sp. AB-CW4]
MSQAVKFGEFVYEADSGRLTGPSGEQNLRPQVARLLDYLLRHPGEIIGREGLAREVWGEDRVVAFDTGLSALLKELRAALGDRADEPHYLETIPRRGVRWLVTPESGSDSTSGETGGKANGRQGALILIAAAVMLAGFVGLLLVAEMSPDDPLPDMPAQPAVPRVAVLPFLSIADDDREQRASLLLADSTIAALAAVVAPPQLGEDESPPMAVIGRTSISGYPEGEALLPALARDLGVDLVVEGSFREEGDYWLVTVSAVRADAQTILLSRSFLVSELSSRAVREHLQGFAIELAMAIERCGEDCLSPR